MAVHAVVDKPAGVQQPASVVLLAWRSSGADSSRESSSGAA
jgi:hypothetical protein